MVFIFLSLTSSFSTAPQVHPCCHCRAAELGEALGVASCTPKGFWRCLWPSRPHSLQSLWAWPQRPSPPPLCPSLSAGQAPMFPKLRLGGPTNPWPGSVLVALLRPAPHPCCLPELLRPVLCGATPLLPLSAGHGSAEHDLFVYCLPMSLCASGRES